MGQIKPPNPVKLIVGMLSRDESLFATVEGNMQSFWGPIDIHSDITEFTQTRYYEKQMGYPLLRKFVAFENLIDPGGLARIKHQSNDLEDRIAREPVALALNVARPINLDPGYIDPSKLILATTKNYSHRIYIGESMYAEVTLHYHRGNWQAWPHTYPDYASGDYFDFLNRTRQKLMQQLSPPDKL